MPPCPSCTICDTMPIKPTIADTLKAAIESSGLPFLTLEQRTGGADFEIVGILSVWKLV